MCQKIGSVVGSVVGSVEGQLRGSWDQLPSTAPTTASTTDPTTDPNFYRTKRIRALKCLKEKFFFLNTHAFDASKTVVGSPVVHPCFHPKQARSFPAPSLLSPSPPFLASCPFYPFLLPLSFPLFLFTFLLLSSLLFLPFPHVPSCLPSTTESCFRKLFCH